MNSEVPIAAHLLYWGPVDLGWCVMGPLFLPPEIYQHLLGLGDVQVSVVDLVSWCQQLHLFQISWLHLVGDQANRYCVLHKFHGGVGAGCGCTIMGIRGVVQGAQDTALGGASVEGAGAWGAIQDPGAEWRAQPQVPELSNQSEGNYDVKRQAESNEEQTCIVPISGGWDGTSKHFITTDVRATGW